MADTLGIHIAPEGITAVRLDAVAGTDPVVITLGESGPSVASVVARSDSGAVIVGDAARDEEGPTVTDPLERAAAGRIGALAAVINHVVGRAVLADGTPPRRVAIVIPDDWDVAARDRVVEAGNTAGATDTVAVPLSAATAQPARLDPVVDVAAGAARVASLAAAPLVTREDLGETVTPKSPVVSSDTPATGPVSVFDPEEPVAEEPPPVPPARPAPAPVSAPPAASPPTRVLPAAGPPDVQPLRYEPPRRRLPVGAIVVVVLVGLIAAVGGALLVFTPGDDDTDVEGSPATSTTAAPATTTEAPATTTEPPTTTDPIPSTTTDPTTTGPTTTESTTTTTEPPSTTTAPVPVDTPGDVTLVETGLQLAGGDLVLFEQDADMVVATVAAVLGDPDRDDPYEASAFCRGERTRFVAWGDLELVFTEEVLDSGVGRFTQWFAASSSKPKGLVTFSGVGVDATVGFLQVTFGNALVLVEPIPGDPTGLFAVTNPGSGAVLNGTTSSRDPEGVITSLWAGDSCTRIFT
jgi:hypothetical protein